MPSELVPYGDNATRVWDDVQRSLSALSEPGPELEALGSRLMPFFLSSGEWHGRLAERARQDSRVASALQEVLLLQERALARFVGFEALARAWCQQSGSGPDDPEDPWLWWSVPVVMSLMRGGSPEATAEGWDLILHLLRQAPNDWVLCSIGAGPLEDLLNADPRRVVELIEDEAPRNLRLRKALAHTWQQDTPDEYFARAKSLADPEAD